MNHSYFEVFLSQFSFFSRFISCINGHIIVKMLCITRSSIKKKNKSEKKVINDDELVFKVLPDDQYILWEIIIIVL